MNGLKPFIDITNPRPLRERDNFNAFSIDIRERGKRLFLTATLQNISLSPPYEKMTKRNFLCPSPRRGESNRAIYFDESRLLLRYHCKSH